MREEALDYPSCRAGIGNPIRGFGKTSRDGHVWFDLFVVGILSLFFGRLAEQGTVFVGLLPQGNALAHVLELGFQLGQWRISHMQS